MDLVRKELQYERDSYRNSLSQDSISGRMANGDCIYPVELAGTTRDALDHLIVHVRFTGMEEDDLSKDFDTGRPATFFILKEGKTEEVKTGCFVSQVGDDFIELTLPNMQYYIDLEQMSRTHLLGLRTAIDETTYRVMTESLSEAMRRDDERWVALRETLVGGQKATFRNMPSVSLPWLNASQQNAVQKVLESRQVSVLHGPPGTGKTTTLVEAIIETLQRETQVMVCAPSNAAVDWISSILTRRGVHVLRVGNPVRMSNEMLECSYERRYAAHPDYVELWNIRKTLRQKKSSDDENARRRQRLRERQTELEIKINEELFGHARVVACTLIGSAYSILERRHFPTLFIDEAAQALEPACWTAILRADRVVLSGDYQQLPPTIKCQEAAREGLEITLMQRVAKSNPECVTLLDTQYRMHRDIMGFSSRWFYHNRLKAAPEVAERLVSLMDTPLAWFDTSKCGFAEKVNATTSSKMNASEAKLVTHLLREYIEVIGMEKIVNDRVDFGIITPYKSQVRLIRKLLKMQRFYRTLRHQISVNTVDGFQGQERDVVLISMVRDNERGEIGFLRDLRRMNVALTRARMKLMVVGNSETLQRHPFYAQLIDYFQEKGSFVELENSEKI